MGGAALGSPRPSPPAPPLPLALRPPGSQDAPPRLDVAGKSLFLSPHCLRGHLLPLPGPSRAGVVARQLSLGWEQAHPHFLLGKLRPREVWLTLRPQAGGKAARQGLSILLQGALGSERVVLPALRSPSLRPRLLASAESGGGVPPLFLLSHPDFLLGQRGSWVQRAAEMQLLHSSG